MVFDRIDKSLQSWQVLLFVVVAVALGAFMAFSTVPHLSDLAEGAELPVVELAEDHAEGDEEHEAEEIAALPLDMNFDGYSEEEVVILLTHIGEDGRSYYATSQLITDTFFTIFLFLAVASLFLFLTRPNARFSLPLPEGIRLIVVAAAVVALGTDLVENVGIWVMIGTYENPPTGIVALSSIATGVKWLAMPAALAALLATIVLAGIRGLGSGQTKAA